MLNASALRIEWDEDDKRQVEEAKTLYRKAKQEGRLITDTKDNVIQFFHPSLQGILIKEVELKPTEFSIRFFDDTGDRRLIWDSSDPFQVKEAAETFQSYLDKGWRGFATDTKGRVKRRVYKFDAEKEEVLFEEISDTKILDNFAEKLEKDADKPKVLKSEKLQNFVKAFTRISALPKTQAG